MTNRTPIIGEMEARKLPTRQDKDGNFIISFSVHPDDAKAKPDLLTAAPGTPFAVRYCTVDYDNPEPPAPEKKRKRKGQTPSQHCATWCGNPQFQEWLNNRGEYARTEAETKTTVRRLLGVKSRAELDTNPEAAERWDRLYNSFMYRDQL